VAGTVASWTLAFGDGTSTGATGAMPGLVRHTFHKSLRAVVRLSVRTTDGRSFSATTGETVSPFVGRVMSGHTPLRGILVSIVDGNDETTVYSEVRTDAKGFWFAPPSLHKARSYEIQINSDGRAQSPDDPRLIANHNFDVEDHADVKPGEGPFITNMPRAIAVTGRVVTAGNVAAPNVEVFACAVTRTSFCGLLAATLTDATGRYTLPLGRGLTWNLGAQNEDDTLETADLTPVTVPLAGTVAGPVLTLAPHTS
jgi:hypothetical protein